MPTKAEICLPSLESSCTKVDLAIMRVVEREQCEEISRTVCTQTHHVMDNEVCVFSYMTKSQEVEATTVSITFSKECMDQMVTVCQPGPGYGFHRYGHMDCKEEEQQTCYNTPMVTNVKKPVMVTFPEPKMVCENKPVNLPMISCELITERKCFMVPELMEDTEMVEKCVVRLGKPDCQDIEIELPQQVCTEINYSLV